MLDHPRLIDQIAKLERRTGRLGKDTITHRASLRFDSLRNSIDRNDDGLRGRMESREAEENLRESRTRQKVGPRVPGIPSALSSFSRRRGHLVLRRDVSQVLWFAIARRRDFRCRQLVGVFV
jgi:hypothetical protein